MQATGCIVRWLAGRKKGRCEFYWTSNGHAPCDPQWHQLVWSRTMVAESSFEGMGDLAQRLLAKAQRYAQAHRLWLGNTAQSLVSLYIFEDQIQNYRSFGQRPLIPNNRRQIADRRRS